MRCVACNVELNDYEATRKDSNDQYIDLCNHCFGTVGFDFEVTDRLDLIHEADIAYETDEDTLQLDKSML